ncbi:putative duf1212 domain membrane protein prm10 protein [Eutypa lata UCREL1]|uniref:Putative duf1212 domain membrane protein prm10 protein n=1 Tax=Eutypa lata (strain UCR-EL1) TaxID=1287681 RepID=M7U1L5_EUTLA|nr:putative duf1212 domain membrane protein prm10 protein [Eutypa lata UCREL1]
MGFGEHPLDGQENGEKPTFEEQRAVKKVAYDLVRTHTQRGRHITHAPHLPTVDPGNHYRGGVLSHLLKLYKTSESSTSTPTDRRKADISGFSTPISSGTATPTRKKWYDQNKSQDTLANLVEASARLGAFAGTPGTPGVQSSVVSTAESTSPPEKVGRPKRPKHRRSPSSKLMSFGRPRMEDEIRITVHIAETLSRQKYIIKLCRALMLYGAPTHRLEEYLQMTARMLEIDSQFLYLPGCMIISFDDRSTHTAEVKIVRTAQGLELGKLKDVHEIYKEVLHDVTGVDEAMNRLSKVMDSGDKYNKWLRVLGFGFAAATVAPFGFDGRIIDMPMCFILGCIVGYLQLVAAPASPIYNNVFEVGATIITSFIARGLGSIGGENPLFCFSAMAQSSIALILPGWFVLCAALELQSKAIVPGSIRMVYAIIYSLFLGFGITVGTVLYGLVDPNATMATTCVNPIPSYYRFFFVPLFTVCLAFVNQAKWKQMPVQIIIAFAGYVVNFFTNRRISAVPQIANTLGALAIGILANLYSRVRHGVAAAALLPAIFVQVPSGLAATGSLLSGLEAANKVSNSTKAINGTSTVAVDASSDLNSMVFSVAGTMIQIAIGITVGLFLSALIIYPLGKRRSGLFTL